jgi:hypothetical protein
MDKIRYDSAIAWTKIMLSQELRTGLEVKKEVNSFHYAELVKPQISVTYNNQNYPFD